MGEGHPNRIIPTPTLSTFQQFQHGQILNTSPATHEIALLLLLIFLLLVRGVLHVYDVKVERRRSQLDRGPLFIKWPIPFPLGPIAFLSLHLSLRCTYGTKFYLPTLKANEVTPAGTINMEV